MNRYLRCGMFLILFTLAGCAAPPPTVESVKADMKRVADWQIEHADDVFDARHRKRPYTLDEWPMAAMCVGMEKWAATADDDTYDLWLKEQAAQRQWKLRPERFYHADDHCIGQLYIELYKKHGDKAMIAPTIEQFDAIMENPSSVSLIYDHKTCTDRWSWCDALFMAPPVWAKLSAVTGDSKYRDWMVDEFRETTDLLFDKEEHLYFRDTRFFEQRHNGKKIFWARGNGWVFGGLALVLAELPQPSADYDYFLGIYQQMAEKLLTLQSDEGFWAMSLLEGETYPTPETSGTGFFCFGLAWGINEGILDRAVYEPAVRKAWGGLTRCITADGMLGYVQPIGAEPGAAWADKTEVYGVGAFLAAGAEVIRMIEPEAEKSQK